MDLCDCRIVSLNLFHVVELVGLSASRSESDDTATEARVRLLAACTR